MQIRLMLALTALFSLPAGANENVQILASIKPVQILVSELTDGVATTELLVPATASAHDFALRPSDVRKLDDAVLIVWMGAPMEGFLSRPLSNPPLKAKALSLLELAGESTTQEHHHEHHDGDHDEGNDADPHFWLDPTWARRVAANLAEAIGQQIPEARPRIAQNLLRLQQNILTEVPVLERQLSPVKSVEIYAMHDFLGHFATPFGLNYHGALTQSPELKPGANSIETFRSQLLAAKNACMVTEPQWQSAYLKVLLEGTTIPQAKVDPLGLEIDVGAGAYTRLLSSIASSLTACLSKPSP